MACLLAPAAEAVVVTAIALVLKSKEKKAERDTVGTQRDSAAFSTWKIVKTRFSTKLFWLSKLLWGGSFLLAFEHVWHGEIIPWFPFLTAAENSADTAKMLTELSTVGVAMSLLVTLFWAGLVLVTAAMTKKALKMQRGNLL